MNFLPTSGLPTLKRGLNKLLKVLQPAQQKSPSEKQTGFRLCHSASDQKTDQENRRCFRLARRALALAGRLP